MADPTPTPTVAYPTSTNAELAQKLQELKEIDKAEAAAQEGAFYRVLQPDSTPSTLESTSYLRLGSYTTSSTAGSEEKLVTGLGTTFSVSEREVLGAERNAEESAESVEKGDDVDPSKRFSTATQASDKISIKRPQIIINGKEQDFEAKSHNNGILLYTNHDLQENVLGAALMKYGKGHHVEVSDYDSKYVVKQGALALAARTGVVISAGRLDPHDTAAPSANVEIISQGYIKQRAYGNLEETTYGDTTKHTHGHVTDWIDGSKTTRIHGADTSMKMGAVTSMVFGPETNLKAAIRISAMLSANFNIYLSYSANFAMGGKLDCIKGPETKIIIGTGTKIVYGMDVKMAYDDTKFVTFRDTKSAFKDFKIVYESGSIISGKKWEKAETTLTNGEITVAQENLLSRTEKLKSTTCRGPVLSRMQLYIFQ